MIEEPPLLTIRKDFPRPDAALVDALRGIPTGYAVDAMNGRGALDFRIKPLVDGTGPQTVFTGVAMTCFTGPNDNLALFGALAMARKGDVLICATEGYEGAGVTGDLLIGMARNRGVAAFVTDGVVRDLSGLLGVGLPIFSRGITPNSPVRDGPGTVGLPITVGGVSVSPGDVLVGDRDGVVVVPQARLAEVVQRLEAVKAAEAALEAKVKAGLEVPDFVAKILESPRIRWL